MKRIRGRMVVPKNDVSVKTVIDACTKVAAQMGTAESQHVLDVVDRICEETGQVHNSKGEPFTFQSVLKGLEMMDLDFDERGNPQMPRFVAGAVAYEKFRTLELSDADEIAWQELVERKRADWRFRESNRKLAG